jgi:lipopolysaccharide export LptBFGC system permease protein LptF
MFAVVASVALFGLQETILADFNREADRLDRQIRGYPPATSTATRTWIAGPNGDVYHFDFYDRSNRTFRRLWLYQFGSADWRLETLTFADTVSTVIEAADAAESAPVTWLAKNGWQRRLSPNRVERSRDTYLPFAVQEVPLAPPDVFERDEPAVDQMTYRQLSQYVELLRSTGARADPFIVAQHRRLAFPLVTVVMTILAIPFAVTTGRHGAMYGIGIGIVLAMIYWTAVSISAAMGAGGLLPPVLAAWAPNTLFAAVAAYGVLTVRT